MPRAVRVRRKPTAGQRAALLETLRVSTACFNAVAEYGWQHEQRNSVELHKATYSALRRQHPTLPSQLVVSARRRAAEAITSVLTPPSGSAAHAACWCLFATMRGPIAW